MTQMHHRTASHLVRSRRGVQMQTVLRTVTRPPSSANSKFVAASVLQLIRRPLATAWTVTEPDGDAHDDPQARSAQGLLSRCRDGLRATWSRTELSAAGACGCVSSGPYKPRAGLRRTARNARGSGSSNSTHAFNWYRGCSRDGERDPLQVCYAVDWTNAPALDRGSALAPRYVASHIRTPRAMGSTRATSRHRPS